MKKTLLITLLLSIICIMPSCVKDSANDKIVFGNNKGMYVTSYEGIPLVVQYGHDSWGYYIDLNGDGQNDIQFHSQTMCSHVTEQYILTELYCHENVALLGENINHEFMLLANEANASFGFDNTFMCTNVILQDNESLFPMNQEKYIGFKITENDKSRLGWMKVILHHDEVELLETAIQK